MCVNYWISWYDDIKIELIPWMPLKNITHPLYATEWHVGDFIKITDMVYKAYAEIAEKDWSPRPTRTVLLYNTYSA